MNINPNRPIEELTGSNRGCVRLRLGNLHVGNSYLQAARHARPGPLRKYPVALRRGWAKCVLDTWREYRRLYRDVMA